jgi:hypothetical protein
MGEGACLLLKLAEGGQAGMLPVMKLRIVDA